MDARIGRIVDHSALASADDIETTEWELQNFAVEVVCDQLVKEGWQLMFWSDDREVNRSLWFGQDAGPTWVVIRAARFPQGEAPRPSNFASLRQTFEAWGLKGHFASEAFADSRQSDASGDEPIPLYRGYGMYAAYDGLKGGGAPSGKDARAFVSTVTADTVFFALRCGQVLARWSASIPTRNEVILITVVGSL